MEVIQLRKHIMPFREALWSIYRAEDGRISNDVKPYIRDVYDHMNSAMEHSNTLATWLSGFPKLTCRP